MIGEPVGCMSESGRRLLSMVNIHVFDPGRVSIEPPSYDLNLLFCCTNTCYKMTTIQSDYGDEILENYHNF